MNQSVILPVLCIMIVAFSPSHSYASQQSQAESKVYQFDPTARPFDTIETIGRYPESDNILSPLEQKVLNQVSPSQRNRYQPGESSAQLLTMIIQVDNEYRAVIGKKMVKKGDYVGLLQVIKITPHTVVLEDGQNTVTLHISGFKQHTISLK